MEKSYDKFYVKKDPGTMEILIKEGKPIMSECAKRDCRLEPRHVTILNKGWMNSGVYFVEVEEKKVEVKEEVETIEQGEGKGTGEDARLALETEAKGLGIEFRSNIGDDKLQEKINKAKNK